MDINLNQEDRNRAAAQICQPWPQFKPVRALHSHAARQLIHDFFDCSPVGN
ncbi:MAG: hypothetical protein IV097_16895 [Burkholderiaceae bacterium]|nr:hypothetical protein [Burkholderiaceae bacterium]